MTVAFNQMQLFGGAITAEIPAHFADVSDIRQVPDNQEVYLDKNGFTSLIFDITERVSHLSTDREALEYHFADIIAEADSTTIRSIDENVQLPNFPPTTPILALAAVTKPPASTLTAEAFTPIHTEIQLTLIRLSERSTDIVITSNTPYFAGNTDRQPSNEIEAGTTQHETEHETGYTHRQVVTSFAINDWGLFSGE